MLVTDALNIMILKLVEVRMNYKEAEKRKRKMISAMTIMKF